MLLNTARRALHATKRQLSTQLSDAIPKPPTAALAKRSQLLRDVRSQRPFLLLSCRVGVERRWRRGGERNVAPYLDGVEVAPPRRRRRGAAPDGSRGNVTGRPAQCTKYLDALEDLDLLSAKEMRVVFEKSERDLVPLDEHVERLTASRNLLAARLREVEDEDVEGHCWPGAC